MKAYTLFQQYIWLVNTIHKSGRLTFGEINDLWVDTEMSEGLPIARSTFNRHRDAILDMFGIVIDCNKKDGFRYFIYNEEVLAEESIQNWMLSTLSVNSELAESKGVYDRILLESIPSNGTYLHRFIEAMKKGVRVSVQYRRYGSDQSSYMKVDPFFVKLHGRRWYALVKFPEPTSYLFTLAFDRIVSLELTEEKYVYNREFDPAGWFNDCYGIFRDEEVFAERVVIRAFGREANYLRDLPLHHSQQEISAGEGYTDFSLTLRPTPDFYSPLLARGAAIRVMEPQWLADEIRQQHQAAFELYK